MSAETVRRESLPLTESDATIVDKLMNPHSLERWALNQLAENVGTTKAAVLRTAFHIGLDRIVETAQDEGYRRLAESMTEEERAERRATTYSRRRARAQRGDE
ncbi:hypothetical protein [Halopolyspora algeriensis]|nr:hypothetical protein [Halopolyspora algeriensis]